MTTGKPEKCGISVGLKYAKGVVQKQLKFMLLVDHKFKIPPGAPAHRVGASRVLDHDAVGVGLFAHMHVRGRDMTFRAHLDASYADAQYSFQSEFADVSATGVSTQSVAVKGGRSFIVNGALALADMRVGDSGRRS